MADCKEMSTKRDIILGRAKPPPPVAGKNFAAPKVPDKVATNRPAAIRR